MDHRSTEILGGELTAQMRARFYGKYRGGVTNVDDPDQIGRIMAKVPEVLGLS